VLGGAGRGEAWAGVVDVDADSEPVLLAALISGEVQVSGGDVAHRVVGPYWTRRAAVVPVDADCVVVLGGLLRAGPVASRLRDVAFRAALQVDRVPPGKRVADDLEVVHAVRAVMALEPMPVRRTLRRLTELAAGALDAGLVVGWIRATGEVVASGRLAGVGEAAPEDLVLAMAELAADRTGRVVQDAADQPLPGALAGVGLASWALLPMGDLGALLVAHGLDRPRGFTTLCCDLGRRFAEAAECVLHAAVVRERLDVALRTLSERARRDELTGAATRAAWDEALVATGPPATALVVRLRTPTAFDPGARRLRDALLRAGAEALRGALRDDDVVARLGPDAFGVLLPGIDRERAPDVADRLRLALATAPRVEGLAVEGRISGASAPGEPSAAAAALVAEARADSARPR
jgi:GGDEF domain-containing protein